MKTDTTQITGLTLIDKALEFESMVPDRSQWTLEKENPPGFVRLQQLNVLLDLFTPETFNRSDIASGLDSLFSGQFILLRDSNKYESLFNAMDSVITSSKHYPKKHNGWNLRELRHNYTDLVNFKRVVNKILTYHNEIMEISYPYFYSVIMTGEIADKLETKTIDEFLSLAIDPFNRTYTKDNLIRDYNYPTGDVYDIDLDYW